jgi:hypothetical protein
MDLRSLLEDPLVSAIQLQLNYLQYALTRGSSSKEKKPIIDLPNTSIRIQVHYNDSIEWKFGRGA